MAKDLLYKPNLSYEKNYYTEGDIYDSSNETQESTTQDNILDNKIDRLDELKNEVMSKLPVLPGSIQDIFVPSFSIIDDLIQDLINKKEDFPDDFTDKPESIPIYKPDTDDENKSDDDVPDNPFGSEEDIYINIPIDDTPIDVVIEKQYTNDLADILEDYLTNYNKAVDNYINSVMTYLSYIETDSIKNYTTLDLSNKNLSHITDYLTKSKIGLNQTVRLTKKLFNVKQTIFHLKAVKIAKEQLKRYKTNNPMEDKNLLTKGANDLLKESILVAEKKYEENFYGLYKYLNSSVILFNECINTISKQKRSQILINNEERE